MNMILETLFGTLDNVIMITLNWVVDRSFTPIAQQVIPSHKGAPLLCIFFQRALTWRAPYYLVKTVFFGGKQECYYGTYPMNTIPPWPTAVSIQNETYYYCSTKNEFQKTFVEGAPRHSESVWAETWYLYRSKESVYRACRHVCVYVVCGL